MSTVTNKPNIKISNPIKGAGLKGPGVVVLQFLLILFFETFEYAFTKVGLFTGVAIIVAFAGGLILGRPGTGFTAVVTPPLAFFASTLILIASLGGAGLSISHIGLDLISMLGAAAPFLVIGAAVSWIYYFIQKQKK